MITDRDLCCSIIADGLNSQGTRIVEFVSGSPVRCRNGENLDKCERAMQEHQIRRIPLVDGKGRRMGIVAQADLALKDEPGKVSKMVMEISKHEPTNSISA
jgi:CBS domain-containing protein